MVFVVHASFMDYVAVETLEGENKYDAVCVLTWLLPVGFLLLLFSLLFLYSVVYRV